MRILHVDDYFLPALGYEAGLARIQLAAGEEVRFVASRRVPAEKRGQRAAEESSSVPHTLLRSVALGNHILWMPGIAGVLVRQKPDTVHCHSVFDLTSLSLALMKPLFGYRLVYCCHASRINTDVDSTLLRRWGYRLFRKIAAPVMRRAADQVVAVGENELTLVTWGLGTDQVQIVRLGADVESFRPNSAARADTRAELQLDDSDVAIVHAGALAPRKQLELLITAVARAVDQGVPARLIIVGDGDRGYINQLKSEIVRNSMEDHITLLDRFVAKRELAGLYAAGDIAIWPGDISIAVVEAMAAGLPLVLRQGDEYREFLISGDNGLLFEQEDDSSLPRRIRELAENREFRARMGRNSRSFALREFDWESIADRFMSIYTGDPVQGSHA